MQKEINWLLKEKYHGKANKKFHQDVERLKKGEPLDYVIGFTEFLSCRIDLSCKPLIPRPETEYWVQKAIEDIFRNLGSDSNISIKVLDIFSGSGCIGISIMRHIQNAKVVFVEKEKNLLKQIAKNNAINAINKKRYRIIQSDVFKKIKGKYDYIFANPPYIPTTRKSNIQSSVLAYEPKEALFGGKDGLQYIKKFLMGAQKHLNPGGKIYMEFDGPQKQEIKKIITRLNYSVHKFYQDQHGRFRFVVIENR